MTRVRVLPLVMAATGTMLFLKATGLALGIAPGAISVTANSNPQPMPPVISQTRQITPTGNELQSMLKNENGIVISQSNPAAIDTIVTGQVAADTHVADQLNAQIAENGKPTTTSFWAGREKYVEDPNNPIYLDQEELTQEQIDSFASNSPARAALLERLKERHTKLQAREGAMGVQQKLLEAAEKRLSSRITELKDAQSELDEKLIASEKEKDNQFAGVVKMYETMKPKSAARIFNSLEMSVLLDVAKRIKPRIMAEILGYMEPESAQKLTIALATGLKTPKMTQVMPSTNLTTQSIGAPTRSLPKIGSIN